MSKEVLFFATKSDIMSGLQKIEGEYSLKYVRSGLFDNEDVKIYSSALEIEELGYNKSGNGLTHAYLVMDQSTQLNIRNVPQQRGGMKYAIDQLINTESLLFAPGGLYGDGYLIFGRITTISSLPVGLNFFKEFTKKVTKGFIKIGRYYVGPEAKLLSNERRLITININQSPEYDLKLT
ncbi:hypothetical protein [Cohnella yongneupensis]|uniref:PPIase cyclophilin-type domain-containing protein n=1 Tax=Cohnella yongneupensis TaxID=425006 RepID=A0ABW0R0X8_9BACL